MNSHQYYPLFQAVQEYRDCTQAVCEQLDLFQLQKVATCNEISKLFPLVQALRCSNNIMKTEIEEFDICNACIDADGTSATVRTKERWSYWWQKKDSGEITKARKVEEYCLEYDLVKDCGSWKVADVRRLER